MNANLLKGQIKANGWTQAQAAEVFGMATNSLNRKLSKAREFTLSETLRIKKCLSLSDQQYYDIFLAEPSHIRNDTTDKTA